MNNHNVQASKRLLLCILITAPFALFLNLNSYQLMFEEPRRALVALEMLISKNNIVPTTNGILYYNKPPLYNWLLILLFKCFGTADWVVRLPTILSLIATSVIHSVVTRRYIGKPAALLSALFYFTCADILFYFSYLGEIDLFYALIVYLQALSIFYFYQQGKTAALFLVSYLLAAAGVLTKGIPSIVFQGITILVIILMNKDYKKLFSFWHLTGIAVFLSSCVGFFAAYSIYQPVEPYLARLFTETFSRSAMENPAGTTLTHLLKFPLLLVKISAPWCLLFLIPARRKELIRDNPFIKYCLWFVAANIVVYWLSPGTRDRYLYMFFPFIFSALAFGILTSRSESGDLWIKRFSLLVTVLLFAGLLVLAFLGFKEQMPLSAIVCLLLSVFPIQFLTKRYDSYNRLLGLVFLILLGRTGYNLTALPNRKKDDRYKQDAQKIATIIRKEPIYLSGEPVRTTDNVKFAGRQFASFQRDEPSYLAFQSSFYISKYSNKIVKYRPDMSKKGFYIVNENAVDARKLNVVYRFRNRKDIWFLLIRKD